ncbi:MAG: AAA family ATPase [Myxococcota bacterium]
MSSFDHTVLLDPAADDVAKVAALRAARDRIRQELHHVIIGQDEVIDLLLIALFARGHCLFEGVPGLAKTLLVSTLADVLNLSFSRIQFTPDLMPSDITGTEILEEDRTTGKRVYRFLQGPVFANILLADEINRTPPKTQAALLQSMQEYRVTAAGQTYTLPPPFMVFATQNPVEQEGTYPLPEAQLDRFMLHIVVRYPNLEDEVQIVLRNTTRGGTLPQKTLSPDEIMACQELVRRVPVAEHVVRYAVRLARATRPKEPGTPSFVNDWVEWGAGPRASQFLILGAKARAVLEGRFAADMSDIKALAGPVLRHRLVMSYRAEAEGKKPDDIVRELLKLVPENG